MLSSPTRHPSVLLTAILIGVVIASVPTSAAASSPEDDCLALRGALLRGDWPTAETSVRDLHQRAPNYRCKLGIPALQRLTERSLQLRNPTLAKRASAPPDRGVGEFMTFMTGYGLASGVMLNDMFAIRDTRGLVAVPMLTTTAAFWGAWQLTKRWQYTAGGSATVTSGVAWGMFYALMAQGLAGLSDKHMSSRLLAGQLAGGVAGFALSDLGWSRATVAGANSGGAWGAIVGGLLVLAVGPDDSQAAFLPSTLMSLGGLALGAHLASVGKLSRQQWALVDVGGAVGTLAGLGIGAWAGDGNVAGVSGAIGAIGGLLIAGWSMADDGQVAAELGSDVAIRFRATMLQIGTDSTNRPVMGAGLVVDRW